MNKDEFEKVAVEDVAYGTQHALNVLLDLLIEKGVISEQDFKDKLDAMIDESPELDEVNIPLKNEGNTDSND